MRQLMAGAGDGGIMEYKITEASKAAAVIKFDDLMRRPWPLNETTIIAAFTAALDELLIGVEEEYRWTYPHILGGYPQKPKPKSIGPGTRLRAKNGDELQVFKASFSENTELYGVINLTKSNFVKLSDKWHFSHLDKLQTALLAAGATLED